MNPYAPLHMRDTHRGRQALRLSLVVGASVAVPVTAVASTSSSALTLPAGDEKAASSKSTRTIPYAAQMAALDMRKQVLAGVIPPATPASTKAATKPARPVAQPAPVAKKPASSAVPAAPATKDQPKPASSKTSEAEKTPPPAPEVTKPVAKKPVAVKPQPAKPVAKKPAASKPKPAKPVKPVAPVTPKPEAAKPQPIKPTAPKPVATFGDKNDTVRTIQSKLSVITTGYYGSLTQTAVREFQISKGWKGTGIVDARTWKVIKALPDPVVVKPKPVKPSKPAAAKPKPVKPSKPAAVKPKPVKPVASKPVATFGDRSGTVRTIQSKLGVITTGYYGPLTQAAVRKFQNTKGYAATGVVDARTWTAIKALPTPAPKPVAKPPASQPTTGTTAAKRQAIVAYAKTFLGIPYVWGGTTRSGVDCSGLTTLVYRHFGVTMPRVASGQQAAFKSTGNPQPGDLVFFGYPAYHVGIWLGDGLMLHAPVPGQVVRIERPWRTPTGYASVL